jgi:hypothetical protein
MKTAHAILIAALAISLAGCVVQGKPKTSTPPAPQPVAAAPAPAPTGTSQPLSLAQTEVQLAPEQPIDQDALTPAPTAEVHPDAPPPARTTRTRPKPPPVTTAEPPAGPVAPVVAPPETERGPVREVLSPAEAQALKNKADADKRTIRAWLNSSKGHRVDLNNPTLARIRLLLKASDEAEDRGDLREAADLAGRALTYLRELQSGK